MSPFCIPACIPAICSELVVFVKDKGTSEVLHEMVNEAEREREEMVWGGK